MGWQEGLAYGAAGAGAGSAFGPIGTAVGGIGGGLLGLFSGNKKQSFSPSQTPANVNQRAGDIGGSATITNTGSVAQMSDEELLNWLGSEHAAGYVDPGIVDYLSSITEYVTPYDEVLAQLQSSQDPSEIVQLQNQLARMDPNAPGGMRVKPEHQAAYDMLLNQYRETLGEVPVSTEQTPYANLRANDLSATADSIFGMNEPVAELNQLGAYDAVGAMHDVADKGYLIPRRDMQAVGTDMSAYANTIAGSAADLNDVIAGNAPSVAVLERQRAMDDAQRAALSMAASSRDPGAWRSAMDAGAQAANAAAQDSAILRAQEIDAARGRQQNLYQLQGDALAGRGELYRDLGSLAGEQVNSLGNITDYERSLANDAFASQLDNFNVVADYKQNLGLGLENVARGYRSDQAGNQVQLEGIAAGVGNTNTGAAASTYGTDVQAAQAKADRNINLASTGLATAADAFDEFGNKKKAAPTPTATPDGQPWTGTVGPQPR